MVYHFLSSTSGLSNFSKTVAGISSTGLYDIVAFGYHHMIPLDIDPHRHFFTIQLVEFGDKVFNNLSYGHLCE